MTKSTGKFAILSKFNRSIQFQVVRLGTKRFVLKSPVGKIGFIECKSRFDLLAQVQARYTGGVAAWSTKDVIAINPKGVAMTAGAEMAFDLLLFSGYVKNVGNSWVTTAPAKELNLMGYQS